MGPLYRAAARLAHRLPYPEGTLGRSLAGRREAAARWMDWAATRGGPLVWAHAASVGESLALLPVVARLRARDPALRVVLTHTSPSVADHGPIGAFARVDYLPLDEPGPVAAALDALRPALLLFSRGDLWPELVTSAARRGIHVAVSGGTVSARSGRLRAPARWVLRPVHRVISWVGAVDPEDLNRWRHLGVPADRVTVTGDPRHDQIAERVPDLRPVALWRAARQGDAYTLVAGSIEPEDDGPLADAVRLAGAEWRWLLVPHATTPGRLDQVESAFRERGVAVARWDGGSAPPPGPVTLLARQGLLADLYYAADAAWVGGGFRAGGLHAACEAAAVAVPILAGPLLATVRDGRLLARAGAATPVDRPAAAARRLRDWAAAPSRRAAEGLRARAALEAGAAGRTAEALAAIAGLA